MLPSALAAPPSLADSDRRAGPGDLVPGAAATGSEDVSAPPVPEDADSFVTAETRPATEWKRAIGYAAAMKLNKLSKISKSRHNSLIERVNLISNLDGATIAGVVKYALEELEDELSSAPPDAGGRPAAPSITAAPSRHMPTHVESIIELLRLC